MMKSDKILGITKMSLIITKKANEIATQDEWFKSLMSSREKSKLLIDAIDFGNEASVLAGPFAEKFAFVEIDDFSKTRCEDNRPLLCQKNYEQKLAKDTLESLIFWPYVYREKIEKVFGKSSEHWYSKEKRDSISNIDIEMGFNSDGYELTRDCSLFATSDAGLKKLFSPLNEQEYSAGKKVVEVRIQEMIEDAERTCPTIEKPFLVYLCGNDDASWSRTFSTFDECKTLLEDLHKYGASAMYEQMYFSN